MSLSTCNKVMADTVRDFVPLFGPEFICRMNFHSCAISGLDEPCIVSTSSRCIVAFTIATRCATTSATSTCIATSLSSSASPSIEIVGAVVRLVNFLYASHSSAIRIRREFKADGIAIRRQCQIVCHSHGYFSKFNGNYSLCLAQEVGFDLFVQNA